MAEVISDVWTYVLVLIGALAMGWGVLERQRAEHWRAIAEQEAEESAARLSRWMTATEQVKQLHDHIKHTWRGQPRNDKGQFCKDDTAMVQKLIDENAVLPIGTFYVRSLNLFNRDIRR